MRQGRRGDNKVMDGLLHDISQKLSIMYMSGCIMRMESARSSLADRSIQSMNTGENDNGHWH